MAGTRRITSVATLRHLWRLARARRWFIIAVLGGALVLGLLANALATRQYTAATTVEISRQRDQVIDMRSIEAPRDPFDLEFYQTQYALLKVRSLAERVADRLRLTQDNRFLSAFAIAPSGNGIFGQGIFGRTAALTPAQLHARLHKAVIDHLLGNITIAAVRGSSLVNVSFTSPDRQLSADVANAWAAEFIDANLARRFNAAGYARGFLERRLVELRQRLEDSERQAVAYAGAQQIINVANDATGGQNTGEKSLSGAELERLDTELSRATADRILAESRLHTSGGSAVDAQQNATLSVLREKRAEVAAEYANMLARFTPDYPQAKALASQVDVLDHAIQREEGRAGSALSDDYRSAVSREDALRAKVTALKGDVLDQRRRAIQYNIYQRDVDTNRELYNALLQRYKEIGIAGGVGTNNVSIADVAIPPDAPSRPRSLLNLLIALFIGLFVAVIGVIALEQIDETLKEPGEVTDATGLPLLGVIPNVATDGPITALDDRKSPLAEAYISALTSLGLSSERGVPRSIAVTSTRAQEGKSATAYALTQSLTQTQRRAILIDADMRSPSVHANLGLPNAAGVSNFLAGEDDLAALIQTDTVAGFAVMAAGPQPPNAAELLTGDRLSRLLERLLAEYDHVIVDAPPILGLADALLIASKVEGTLFIIEANGPRAGMVRSALHRLRLANARIFGALLTRFDPRRSSQDYGYGYGYGAGYGYGGRDKAATERAQ